MIRLAVAAALLIPNAPADDSEYRRNRAQWGQPHAPFRIAGNLYYVGTAELAAYLVTDPAGHVLIDAPLAERVPAIVANIEALGFRPRDVRRLLVNHAHWDHADGLAAMKRATGAPLWASAADRETLESGHPIDRDDLAPMTPVRVDRVLKHGETVRLGTIAIRTIATPGHTPGCTSFALTVSDPAIARGRPLDVLLACSLSVAGQKLVGNPRYPAAASDFRTSFATLEPLRPDIFVNFHASGFDMAAKYAALKRGDRAAFVDRGEWPRRLKATRAAFETEFARQRANHRQ